MSSEHLFSLSADSFSLNVPFVSSSFSAKILSLKFAISHSIRQFRAFKLDIMTFKTSGTFLNSIAIIPQFQQLSYSSVYSTPPLPSIYTSSFGHGPGVFFHRHWVGGLSLKSGINFTCCERHV
jgi:hypothetical protein